MLWLKLRHTKVLPLGAIQHMPQKTGYTWAVSSTEDSSRVQPRLSWAGVWRQAYLAGSCFTLISKVNNCTTHPVGRRQERGSWTPLTSVWSLHESNSCSGEWSSACHLQSLTWEELRPHQCDDLVTPMGWSLSVFSAFLQAKLAEAMPFFTGLSSRGYCRETRSWVLRKLPWEITYGAVERLKLSNTDHRKSWSTGNTSLCQVP